jgi:predicted ester cyclase
LHRVVGDVAFEEQEVIAANDRVLVRGLMRGKHLGRLLGVAPTGRQIEISQVHIFRLAGDMVAEHRATWGELSFLLRLVAWP